MKADRFRCIVAVVGATLLISISGCTTRSSTPKRIVASEPAATWISYRANNSNTASVASRGLTGTVKWKATMDEGPVSEAVFNGRGLGFLSVRKMPTQTRTYAFRCSDGEIVWKADSGHSESIMNTPTPAVDSTRLIYVVTLDGRVLALDGATGDQRWSFDSAVSKRPVNVGSPKAAGDSVYVNIGDTLYALDKSNGKLRWKEKHMVLAAIAQDGTLLAGSETDVKAIDPISRQTLWQVPFEVWYLPILDVRLNRLYATDGYGKCHCLQLPGGKELWVGPRTADASMMAAGADGPIFVISTRGHRGTLYAIDRISGKVAWTYAPVTGMMISPCVGGDGTVYTTLLPKLLAIDGKTHRKKWALNLRLDSVASSPSLDTNGKLYIANGKGTLYAIE